MLSQIKDSYNILSALLLSDNSANVSTVHIDYTLKFYANNYYSPKAKRASAHGNFLQMEEVTVLCRDKGMFVKQ